MNRDQVFISYSHDDEKWLQRLQAALKPLVRKYAIDIWSDERIGAGQEWKAEITAALARAKVAVLLVSQSFLASDFIADEEMPAILAAAQEEGLTIIWIPPVRGNGDPALSGRTQSQTSPRQSERRGREQRVCIDREEDPRRDAIRDGKAAAAALGGGEQDLAR